MSGYQRHRHFVWVAWERPEGADADALDFTGFRARILRNPTMGEVNAELDLRKAWLKGEITIEEYLEYIAPRVSEWEYEAEDASGKMTAVPAPGSGPENWKSFLLLENELSGWLIGKIRTIHFPKAMTQSLTPAPTTDSPNPSPTGQEKEPPPS